MQECGGAASAGGLSFSDNGGDDDTLPSLSLPLDSMAAAAAAAEKKFLQRRLLGIRRINSL